MRAKNVLIIGQTTPDPHIERVSLHLRAMGASPVLFDLSKHLIDLSLIDGKGSGYVVCDGQNKIPFESVHSVWFRLKQWCDHGSEDAAVRSEVRFAWAEWMEILYSLQDYVAPQHWVNGMAQNTRMSHKAVQHVLASQIGFRIPETAITNDVNSVVDLFRRHPRVIYKPNKMPALSHLRAVFTTEIDLDTVRSSPEHIRMAPGIFQELIEKEYELRVTVVGQKVFAVRINSQSHDSTRIDWRRSQMRDGMYEATTLDPQLTERILEFHRRADLIYGAYDLIVSKSGEPVFLEVNPAGQWLWMEELLDLPISKELAAQLVSDR